MRKRDIVDGHIYKRNSVLVNIKLLLRRVAVTVRP